MFFMVVIVTDRNVNIKFNDHEAHEEHMEMNAKSQSNKIRSTGRCCKITFSSDGLRLSGTLHLPQTNNPPVVIGSHGLIASSNSPKQIELAKRCTESGIAYFRFDHRGCGASEGVFTQVTSLEARCNDLLSAIELMKARKDVGDRIGLFGSSMGGAVCIALGSTIDVVCLVTYAAPVRSRNITKPIAEVPGSIHSISTADGIGLTFDLSTRLSAVHHILVIHGDADEVVPIASAKEIYEAAAEPKKLMVQPGGDHPMSHRPHQEQFVRDAMDWFRTGFFG